MILQCVYGNKVDWFSLVKIHGQFISLQCVCALCVILTGGDSEDSQPVFVDTYHIQIQLIPLSISVCALHLSG